MGSTCQQNGPTEFNTEVFLHDSYTSQYRQEKLEREYRNQNDFAFQ